jgi:hypothetical protein
MDEQCVCLSQPSPPQWGIVYKIAYVRCVLEENTSGKLPVFLPVPEIGHNAPKTNLETLYTTRKYALGNCIMHMRLKIVPLIGHPVWTRHLVASEVSVGVLC